PRKAGTAVARRTRTAGYGGRLLGGERGRDGVRPSRPALALLGRRGARARDAALPTPPQHRPPRCQVTSNRFRTGQDKESGSSHSRNPPPTSSVASSPRQKPR